jgi:hypothetical protein
MVLGVVSTVTALGGYWLMTLSPVEGAHFGVGAVRGLLFSQSVLIVGAFASGPLFGWLGHRWRTDRSRVGALALAGAVCLEPLAHAAVGSAIRSPGVWAGEIAAGLLMTIYVVSERRLGLSRRDTSRPG